MADALGVRVTTRPLEPGLLGVYDADHHAISLTLGLTPVERRCVLAHELGHAVHRHRDGSPSNERAADAFAARMLVDPESLRRAAMWTHEPWELAEELDLTEEVVRDYLTLVAPRASA